MIELETILRVVLIAIALIPLGGFIGEALFTAKSKNNYLNLGLMLIGFLLSCSKCFSFWIGIALTQDLFLASVVSLTVAGIDYVKDRFITTSIG